MEVERNVFFFFSSRRRHTRCSRDWSSDVCSSDLSGRSSALGGRVMMRSGMGSSPVPNGSLALRQRASAKTSVLSTSDRKSTRLNSSHGYISYAVFCLKKKTINQENNSDVG